MTQPACRAQRLRRMWAEHDAEIGAYIDQTADLHGTIVILGSDSNS